MSLSTDPYKGVRDFYPDDMAVQQYIFDTWAKTAESFGFERYDASALEPAELYATKTSEEIVGEQTYTFTDRGDREVTLRPEMTPTVARMVAGKRRELQFPLRWYSMPNLFRYERTQRGRLREHWQLNCDIFGGDPLAADVEIILLASSVLKAFGATEKDFEIKINNRHLLETAILPRLTDPGAFPLYLRLLDRKAKMDPKEFKEAEAKLVRSGEPLHIPPNEDVNALLEALRVLDVPNVVFDPTTVRGFDYYTGTVFEVSDTHKDNNRSLLGGGRYDNLTALFGGDPIPGVGFGMGDVTMRDFLEVHDLLPTSTQKIHAVIILPDLARATEAEGVAKELREHGVNVSLDLSGKKLGEQIARADKRNIPFVITVGDDELKSGAYALKKLADGSEFSGTTKDIALEIMHR